MTYQNNSLLLAQRPNTFSEKIFGHFSVNGWDGVIKEVYVSITVESPGEGEPGFLSSWERDTPLPHDSLIFLGEDLEIVLEAWQHNCPIVLGLVEHPAKDDIALDCIREEDWLLLDIGDRTLNRKLPGVVGHFPEDGS